MRWHSQRCLIFHCQTHTASQEQAVSKSAQSWLSDNMKVSSLSVGSTFQWFVLHYREFEQQRIPQSLEDPVRPHFRFQIQMAHHCCCRCLAIVSCLAALCCCLNHQLMIRRHRQTVEGCVLVMNHFKLSSSAAPQNSNFPLRSTTQSLLVVRLPTLQVKWCVLQVNWQARKTIKSNSDLRNVLWQDSSHLRAIVWFMLPLAHILRPEKNTTKIKVFVKSTRLKRCKTNSHQI